jgi:hypothetical protein
MNIDIRSVIMSQLLASLATLKSCIQNCPKDQLNERHQDYPFSQVAFHALFYCDFYLSRSEDEFFKQPFHIAHKETFDDYEELEYKIPQKLYEYDFLMSYVGHCKDKIVATLQGIEEKELQARAGVKKNEISKMELFIDTSRHTQHHAAQLGLRVQFLTGKEMDWVESGWK